MKKNTEERRNQIKAINDWRSLCIKSAIQIMLAGCFIFICLKLTVHITSSEKALSELYDSFKGYFHILASAVIVFLAGSIAK